MSEEINESQNEMATEEASPLPFRVLWWRALAAAVIGGFGFWIVFYIWNVGLGRLFFPSAYQDPKVLALWNASPSGPFYPHPCGVLYGLSFVLSQANRWIRGAFTVLCVWIGLVFFLVMLVIALAIFVFLGHAPKTPPPGTQPTLMQISPILAIWQTVPWIVSGALLLQRAYRMNFAGRQVNWLQTTRENIRENFIAVLKPNEKHRLERFVLQSPLSIEECRARLPQIADVETSPFAFWEKLPLPGFKPLTVKAESNRWRFLSRYRKSGFAFYVDLTEVENGTQFQCVSRLNALFKYYSLIVNAIFLFMLALFVLIFCSEIVLMLFNQKPASAGPFIGLLFMGVLGLFFFAFSRFYFSISRQQELMVIEKLQEVLEAQIIEREPVHYKWGLIEQS